MEQYPKVLLKCVNKVRNKESVTGPFIVGEECGSDPEKICKMLIGQVKSVFSELRLDDKMFSLFDKNGVTGVVITEDNIIKAGGYYSKATGTR